MTDTTTEYRTIPHNEVTPGLHARLRSAGGFPWGPYHAIYTERGWYDLTGGQRIVTGALTIIEVPVEPQPAPEPDPAVTDEQRAAVEWLRDTMNRQLERHAGILFEMLPSELTAPQPALPTEPGRYEDRNGDGGWEVYEDGTWHYNGGVMQMLSRVQQLAPFRRLVPERPPVTRERVRAAIGPVVTNVMNYPDEVSSRLLGQDLSHLVWKTTDAVVALTDGTDQ